MRACFFCFLLLWGCCGFGDYVCARYLFVCVMRFVLFMCCLGVVCLCVAFVWCVLVDDVCVLPCLLIVCCWFPLFACFVVWLLLLCLCV